MSIRPFSIGLMGCVAALWLSACGSTSPLASQSVYDFGPGAQRAVDVAGNGVSTAAANVVPALPDLLLTGVDAAPALDGTAMVYRLGYAGMLQQLRPYAQARWSMPPALLLRQQLRERLGQRRSVLTAGDAGAARALALRVELEEFSQVFDAVDASRGLIRVRITLSQPGVGAKTLAQTRLVVQQASSSADAAGGAHALALAGEALAAQIDQWVEQHSSAP